MKTTETIITWACDRCPMKKEQEHRPKRWGTLMIDADAGYDFQDVPWTKLMQEPLLLCDRCLKNIIDKVNERME